MQIAEKQKVTWELTCKEAKIMWCKKKETGLICYYLIGQKVGRQIRLLPNVFGGDNEGKHLNH